MWLFDWISDLLFGNGPSLGDNSSNPKQDLLEDDFTDRSLHASINSYSSLKEDDATAIVWPESLGVFDINPANGLPMIDGLESTDVLGNPYGFDNQDLNGGHPGIGHTDW